MTRTGLEPAAGPRRAAIGWWPRGVRGRLVATYTLAALLLTAAGGLLFLTQLRRGLDASLDASLDARAAPLVSSLAQPGDPDLPDTPPTVARTGNAPEPESLTVVYRPNGQVADSAPLQLQALPLSDADLTASRTRPRRLTRMLGDEKVRLVVTAVPRPDGTWTVVVGASVGTVNEASGQVSRALLLAGPLLIVIVGFGAWLLSGAALRPVDRMRRDAADLGEHDPAGRISEPHTGDELAALAETFNLLLDRLHRSADRQRALVADAGHELRTPLAVLRTELELADRPHRSREDLAEAVSHARGEVERLSRLAEDMLFLARVDGGQPLIQAEPLDLAGLLEDAARASRGTAQNRGITLTVNTARPLPAVGDPTALRRAVDNLLANALAATPAGGTVTLAAETAGPQVTGSRPDATGWFHMSVCDSGPGFPAELLPHALQRFRRGDPSRTGATGGAGLGLAIADEIMAAHGGEVTLANRPAGGAQSTLRLPRQAQLPT